MKETAGTLARCQEIARSWKDWNHDTANVRYIKAERVYVADVTQICEPFRTSAVATAKTRKAALAGLEAILLAGPEGRRPT